MKLLRKKDDWRPRPAMQGADSEEEDEWSLNLDHVSLRAFVCL
jgi:hypothetical protein